MHSIVFKNCENSWKNALPLGNGCFGAMAFWQDGSLSLPLNHYEVYYNISSAVLPEDKLKATSTSADPGGVHRSYRERADRNQPKDGEPFYYYRMNKPDHVGYATRETVGSYPSTGEMRFEMSSALQDESSLLALDLADASVRLDIGGKLRVESYIARKDVSVTHIHQSERGLLPKIYMEYPAARDRDYPDVAVMQIDGHTFAWTAEMMLSGTKPFRFAGIIRLCGASGSLEKNAITLSDAGEDFTVLCTVLTEWRYADPLADGIRLTDEYEKSLETLRKEHRTYWSEFFSRSRISLPDKFLERVYYINQYALDCSSGKDGVMKHHACGLNGLWDIRHPNLWGSMWYWDVNIQAAFAGVFSSNRLDLGKVFSDGLLTYTGLAEKFAKNTHGMSGAALDYPYTDYYCVWPWCAQYLWAQYEYSQDKEYLKNEAYPLFRKLCLFALDLFEYDESRGEYVVYPDISPEQGPLAHNTVITVSSVKYMLKFTLEAAEILGDTSSFVDDCRRLYEGLPAYPTVTDDYGTRLLDSEDAPANLWIRHPSMLMPVFPTGEIDLTSSPEMIDIARNTITFLEEHCEIGVFQVSWLAAAAARLGNGQKALRLLYEMGMDHLLRSNGLAAEENERFMNYCLIMRQPLYYPCMMEFTGEMLAAVNEMLLQSHGGLIRLFPAMPDGDPEYDRMIRHGYSLHEYDDRCNHYPAWTDVRFDRMLARGAFEVSAELKDARISWAKITSRVGGTVRITSPYSLDGAVVFCGDTAVECTLTDNILSFETETGCSYEIRCAGIPTEYADTCGERDVLTHLAYTKRRIYIGENEETEYEKKLDSFIRDWYLGNVRLENHTVYKFDFGGTEEKDYSQMLFRQGFAAEEMLVKAMKFLRPSTDAFTVRRGYGFDSADNLQNVDRGAPDALRQDFAEGDAPAEFLIEVPRGQYELLVISGDAEEDSVTALEAVGGRSCGGNVVKAGTWQCELIPIIHERDGMITLRLSTKPGYKWKLNAILMNMVKQF